MHAGAITGYIDVAQLTLYGFWIFFAGLIFYLRREDKREGYPLESDRSAHVVVRGLPDIPSPKVFLLPHGGTVMAPRVEAPRTVAAEPVAAWPGAPLRPTGNPMIDGVGPASYALRSEQPDRMWEDGTARLMPLRLAGEITLSDEDPDPRGMTVVGADGVAAGTIRDAWVDRADMLLRYLEVELPSTAGPRYVLLPTTMLRIDANRKLVRVASILAAQFADAPALSHPDQVSLREEDRIAAYYASGHLYATPARLGPLL